MERDFGNEVKSLHNELTDANNTIQTLENDLRIQEQNDQADKGRLDEDWKAHCQELQNTIDGLSKENQDILFELKSQNDAMKTERMTFADKMRKLELRVRDDEQQRADQAITPLET